MPCVISPLARAMTFLVQLATWMTSHEGILGTLLGAITGFAGAYLIQLLQRRRQQNIARIQVVTILRHWIKRVSGRMSATRTHVESDGRGGTAYNAIPEFRFEGSLEQVSLLDERAPSPSRLSCSFSVATFELALLTFRRHPLRFCDLLRCHPRSN